ncbi:MAG TPA: hypothetical protein VNK46_00325, partial [Nitrospiraceae bacterium]|nr:hypothetical protein [Nitrospiraceae bacterium]
MIARRLLAALVLFLLGPWQVMAQAPSAVRILDSNGVPIGPGNPMPITGGSSGDTSAVDNSTFIGGTTSITPMGALYDTTPPPITDGNVGVPRMDANRILMVNCQSGCAGASGDGTSQGPLGALNDAVSIALSTYHGAAVNFSGTAITGTVVAEGSNDGGATYPFQVWFLHPATGVLSTSLTNPSGGDYSFAWVGAISHVRVRVSAFTSGGPLTARLRTTATNTISIMVGSDGSNLRVLKTDTSGNLAMDVADRATRKVGQVFLRNPGDTANMGDAATPVRVDPTGTTTQPVSGTVTANQGSPAGQANRWPVFLSDGAAERGTAANPLRVDPTGTTAQPVSGTVSANLNAGSNLVGKVQLRNPGNTADLGDATNPVRVDPTGTTTQPVSGTVSANLNAGSNLVGKVQLRNPGNTADLGDAANPIRIDPTGTTTQPVSGTVTANAGTGTFTVAGTVTANAGTGTFIVDQLDTASLDYDTGAGTVNQTVVGIALPGPGGPVAGGTSSNPIRIDPTGTTTQPV